MAQKTLKITLWDGMENVDVEHEIPAKNAVCSRCEGEGRHLHPAIGSYAYTRDEFEEAFSDDEQREAYFAGGHGMYGVACEVCNGAKVVPVPDVRACKAAGLLEVLREWRKQERRREQQAAQDRRTQWFEDGCPRDW